MVAYAAAPCGGFTASLNKRVIAIKSGGEMGSAIAWRLYQARMCRIVILETPHPLAVRRTVSFCEAVHDGACEIEGVRGVGGGR